MPRDTKAKCYHCQNRGTLFRLGKSGTHCHCEHPDISVSGEPGWDTLRMAFETCKYFEAKKEAKP